jgi:hypothetical protein
VAITQCGHAEVLFQAIAEEIGVEVEDVERAWIKATVHLAYAAHSLRLDASPDTVARVVRAKAKRDFPSWFYND